MVIRKLKVVTVQGKLDQVSGEVAPILTRSLKESVTPARYMSPLVSFTLTMKWA